MTILVVDDDRAVCEALRRALTLGAYEVQLAESGEQALESVMRSLPEVLVLDTWLPGMDGLELCRHVRRLGSRVPILFLTGRAPSPAGSTSSTSGRTTTWSSPRRGRAEGPPAGPAATGEASSRR